MAEVLQEKLVLVAGLHISASLILAFDHFCLRFVSGHFAPPVNCRK